MTALDGFSAIVPVLATACNRLTFIADFLRETTQRPFTAIFYQQGAAQEELVAIGGCAA
jgi:hypothetical protein